MRPTVITFGAFGELVMLTPLLALLHRRYGAPCTLATTGTWADELFARGHPDIALRFRIGGDRHYWLSARQRRFVQYLRGDDADPIYVCAQSRREKVGELLRRGQVHTDRCLFWDQFPEDTGLHWSDRWLAFGTRTPPRYANGGEVREVERPTVLEFPPRLQLAPEDRSDLQQWLRRRRLCGQPLLLIQPGNKRVLRSGRSDPRDDHKAWPIERWQALCERLLLELPDARVLLIGAPAEQPLLQAIRHGSRAPIEVAARDLPIRRLLALQEHALAMISVDTGPAHSAAALGCPIVILYGAEPPALWSPHSGLAPVIAVRADPSSRSVRDIAVEQVVSAWRILRESPAFAARSARLRSAAPAVSADSRW